MDTSWLSTASFIVTLLAIPSLVGLFWKDVYEKRKSKSQKEKKKRQDEFKGLVKEVIQEEIQPLKEDVKNINTQMGLVADGTLSSLRNDIKECFYKCAEKGYRNDYDFQNMYDLYESYKNLGGNSFIEDIMHRFYALPPREDYAAKGTAAGKKSIQKNTRIQGNEINIEGGAPHGE